MINTTVFFGAGIEKTDFVCCRSKYGEIQSKRPEYISLDKWQLFKIYYFYFVFQIAAKSVFVNNSIEHADYIRQEYLHFCLSSWLFLSLFSIKETVFAFCEEATFIFSNSYIVLLECNHISADGSLSVLRIVFFFYSN